MTRSLGILGGLLAVSGAIFIGQGLGLLRGSSFMVDDIRWSWIGAALVVVGIVIMEIARRRTRRGR